MQKVAAYLLERRDDMEWPEARAAEVARLKAEVRNWLRSKGAPDIVPTGTYKPENNSDGNYTTQEATDGDREWWMIDLQEDTIEGRRFSASVSVTSAANKVSVYVSLETGWTTAHVMPILVDPRCPRIVRDLLTLPGRWFHGASLLSQAQAVTGFDQGEALVRSIEYADRSIPILTVSKFAGEAALPDLESRLGYDLTGLANIYALDEGASWALTDILGLKWCCYHGAVRLFWPHFSANQDRFSHPLWTAERLRSRGGCPREIRDQFRRQIRGLVFRASALSVVRPREIDEIRDASIRRAFTELRQRATSLAEYRDLADSYATDNDQLRTQLANSKEQIDVLQEQIRKLESDKLALQAHLAAKSTTPDVEADAGIAPCGDTADVTSEEPTSGEIRFYKKAMARPTHDVMRRVNDCGCNKWEGAHSADKAKKGIAKLENDRSDWKMIQHCASCTGGGMWKVRW